jgi:predicted AlkP superfamily pyrophosphatase or phosphodiesterase
MGLLFVTTSLAQPHPRLILQITVDQLRADMPHRYYSRLGEGGFRYLYEKGIVYEDAHHPHANTETIVGHTTLATGAYPSAHGMVGNVWLDRDSGELIYNIEDSRYRILSADAGVDQETEIDPTQRVARSEGRSPAAILVSTFSDELALSFGGKSKIFGVSVKDRGAVSMAGHAGKAFWFSKKTGEFVTSSFYYTEYPDWVSIWNEKRHAFQYENRSWELSRDKSSYRFGGADDKPWETDFPGYGRTFPHPYGSSESPYFLTLLTLSPAGDELTLDFAKTLTKAEDLGHDEVPDYLAVSFSSTDYVGHLFGPSSLESEDNLLRLDRTLAQLFQFVDQRIGLDKTLIVLSADHGAPEVPGYLNELGIEADYFDPSTADELPGIEVLKGRLGVETKLVANYSHPYVYLDHEAGRTQGLNPDEVEVAIAEELEKVKGIALALPSSKIRNGNIPDLPVMKSVLRNFNPRRSGDIYVVFEPHWFINDFDGLVVASSHGSPWRYDTFVPVVFAGFRIPARRVYRRVHTVDVAPTLSAILKVKPPSGSAGSILAEVLSFR